MKHYYSNNFCEMFILVTATASIRIDPQWFGQEEKGLRAEISKKFLPKVIHDKFLKKKKKKEMIVG